MGQPVFSIVVPVYKVEKYIRTCVDSLLHQDFDDYEIILVDDGSPDSCPDICDEYARKNENIKVVHKENGGLVSARNAGLKVASGEYVFYVDSDDSLKSGALKIMWEKAIEKYHPDMLIFNMIRVFPNERVKDPCYVKEGFYDRKQMEKEILPYMMYDRRIKFYHGLVFPSSGGKVVKRNILLEHYCKDEKIRMGEDNAYIFECLFFSDSVYFMDDYFYVYNQIEGSMRHNYDAKRFENNRRLINYIQEHLGGKTSYIDFQINAFKAYWMIMAIFHEVKSGRPIPKSSRHIKIEIEKNESNKNINLDQLPRLAKAYVNLINHKKYTMVILAAKMINTYRNIKNENKN